MKYQLEFPALLKLLLDAETKLFNSVKHKFEKTKLWREAIIPNKPGIYALFEGKDKLLYVGETGNLRERMNDINRTVNHSFRRKLGLIKFGGIKSKTKFSNEVENQLDIFYTENLYVSILEVNFGRIEIETFIIDKHQELLLNSEKKRKIVYKDDQ